MASDSLYEHYLEYILSPPVLLTLWIILVPVLLSRYKDHILPASVQSFKSPHCFRLGLRKDSNLADQYQKQPPSKKRQSSLGGANLTGSPRIKALFTYPLKSCRGVELAASEVGATGLKYDRLFTFAHSVPDSNKEGKIEDDEMPEWRFITQRQFPKLALLRTELWVPDPRSLKSSAAANGQAKTSSRGRRSTRDLSPTDETELAGIQKKQQEDWGTNGGCMIVRFPHEPAFNPFGLRTETTELRIPLSPTRHRAVAKEYSIESLKIWKDCAEAINMTNEIDAESLSKLKAFLGVKHPLALFRVNDQDKRLITRALPQDRPDETYNVGFADAFPVNILNLASIRALDSSLPNEASMKDKLNARRFRANIYITGPSAYAEDSWKRITFGRCIAPRAQAARDRSPVRDPKSTMVETDGLYHVALRCARCSLPNTDPETGVKDSNEPLTTMRGERAVDEGAKPTPVLGLHTIPLFKQGIVRVGDEIDVLERGVHVYEKMFKKAVVEV